jgi:hypothetical protein
MALVAIGAVPILIHVVRVPGRLSGWLKQADVRSPGQSVRAEITDVFLPPALASLGGRDPATYSVLRSRETLGDALREQGLERVWYVTVLKNYRDDGTFSETALVHFPCEEEVSPFDEFQAIVRLAGNSEAGRSRPDYLAKTRIHVIPKGLLQLPPHEAVPDLMLLRETPSATR